MVKANDQQNFNPAGPGVCYVYGMAYSGSLQNTSMGTPIDQISATNGDSLSRNFITVMRDTLDGGRIETPDGKDSVEVVINGNPSVINFTTTSVSKERNYTFVITNSADTILNPDAGTSQDFNPAGTGTCYVYGVAHQGQLNAQRGMAISDISAEEGFERSENSLAVNRVASTGIESAADVTKSVEVFPNPAQSHLNIRLQAESANQASLRVTDIAGHTLINKQVQLNQGRNKFSIQLDPEMDGVYFITFQQEESTYQQKLVVE